MASLSVTNSGEANKVRRIDYGRGPRGMPVVDSHKTAIRPPYQCHEWNTLLQNISEISIAKILSCLYNYKIPLSALKGLISEPLICFHCCIQCDQNFKATCNGFNVIFPLGFPWRGPKNPARNTSSWLTRTRLLTWWTASSWLRPLEQINSQHYVEISG